MKANRISRAQCLLFGTAPDAIIPTQASSRDIGTARRMSTEATGQIVNRKELAPFKREDR